MNLQREYYQSFHKKQGVFYLSVLFIMEDHFWKKNMMLLIRVEREEKRREERKDWEELVFIILLWKDFKLYSICEFIILIFYLLYSNIYL